MKRLLLILLMLSSLQAFSFAETIDLGNKTYENDYHKVTLLGSEVEVYNKILKTTTKITPTKVNNTFENKMVYNALVEFPNGKTMTDGFLQISTQKNITGLNDYIRLSYSAYRGQKTITQNTINIFDYTKVQAPYANVLWFEFFYNNNEGGYKSLDFSRQPEEVNGDIVAPLVDMAAKTGFHVDFNKETGLIKCSNGIDKIVYEIGSPFMKVNGKLGDTVTIKTNVAVYTNDGTPMVSVRKYFETLGYWVSWDEDNRTMDIRGEMRSYIDVAGMSNFQNRQSGAKDIQLNHINIEPVDTLDEIYPFRVRVGQFYNIAGELINDYQFGIMKKDGSVLFDALASEPIKFWNNIGSLYHYNKDTSTANGGLIDRKGNYILQGNYNKTSIDLIGTIFVSDRDYKVGAFTQEGIRLPRTKYDSGNKLPNGLGQYLVSSGYNAPVYLTNQKGEIINDNDLIGYEKYTADYNYSTISSRMERSYNNRLCGIADAKGNVLVPPIFRSSSITHIYKDIFSIVHDGQIHYIDVSKEDMTDVQDHLLLETDKAKLYQTIHNNSYGLKITNKDNEEIAVARAHYKDFYDNRYIIMHEYLDNGFNFDKNKNIEASKREAAFLWQAYFYESGWYYQLIYDTEKETFIAPPKNSGAYLGNGYFEYRNLDQNYFGLIHLDGHIVEPQSALLDKHKTKDYPPHDDEYGEEMVPYSTTFK